MEIIKNTKIKIPQKTLTNWKLGRFYGDITAIVEWDKDSEHPMKRATVTSALYGAESYPEVIDKITQFYTLKNKQAQ